MPLSATDTVTIDPAFAQRVSKEKWRSYWCLFNFDECYPPRRPRNKAQRTHTGTVPPYALQQMTTGSAISSLLESVGYLSPDQEGGPDPNVPLGPYNRDALVGLSVIQLASRLSDANQARELQAAAERAFRDQLDRITVESGRGK